MASKVLLIHPLTGVQRAGFWGVSWTSLFFGGLPAVLRGDVGAGLGILLLGIAAGHFGLQFAGYPLAVLVGNGLTGICLATGLGWFVITLVWALNYNRLYTTRLLEAGYKLADLPEKNRAAQLALGVGDQAILTPSQA